jgi:hypothetical protein
VADFDLTLPATVATELGASDIDPRIPRLVSAASRAITRLLNRRLHFGAAISEKARGHGRSLLCLDVTPLVSVASVTLADGTVLTGSEFSIENAEAGLLYRVSGWPSTGRFRGGLPPQTDLDAGSEAASIVVVYAGGWVTPAQASSSGWSGPARSLPEDIEEACVQTVVGLFRRGGQADNISTEALGDYSVSYRAPNALIGLGFGGIIPDSVMPQLNSYRRPEG